MQQVITKTFQRAAKTRI